MKPSEILFTTAIHIETYGWARYKFADVNSGESAKRCRVCPRGGMSVAVGRHPTFAAGYGERGLEAVDPDVATRYRNAFADVSAAEKAFAAYLGRRGLVPSAMADDPIAIEWWNDRRADSAEQVVEELRSCAAELAAGGR